MKCTPIEPKPTNARGKRPMDVQNNLHTRWLIENAHLITSLTPGDFKSGVILVNAIAYLAEKHQHHPTLTLGYNQLDIRITTHDAGRLTNKDYRLATAIDKLLED
ncbi:MAG: 4a-hydroxytetrahydrobiopterin dehydratase [Halothiobacillus sp.]|jgi:4a-hydroxytetrahydrobiopterin dehydratase|nr:4a-hydroxytetrahydrobiopterin dehydratase [Halothiobacillus sp.]